MEKLDKYIKECNLVFTNTINESDFCKTGFDIDKTEINYVDSINLLHLVSSFNKLYLSFKKEYDELDKLNLGKNIKVFDKKNYLENIELDNKIAKKYLDLFEKYSLLLETYNYLKRNQIFGDGTNYIFTVIDSYNNNFLEGLKTFKLSFGSAYLDTEYYAELLINLGDNFGLDYNNCTLILDCENIKPDEETCKKLLNDIYLNKKYIKK